MTVICKTKQTFLIRIQNVLSLKAPITANELSLLRFQRSVDSVKILLFVGHRRLYLLHI